MHGTARVDYTLYDKVGPAEIRAGYIDAELIVENAHVKCDSRVNLLNVAY